MSSEALNNLPEPCGYFRSLPFGWEDCAPFDEGAQALYDEGAIRTQAARIAELEAERGTAGYARKIESLIAERDQLRAEVERLRGERMVFVELVRDLLQVVDTIQPHSDETTEIEMLHELTTRARSAIDGVLRAIEAAKEAK